MRWILDWLSGLARKCKYRQSFGFCTWAVVLIDMQESFLKGVEDAIKEEMILAQMALARYCAARDIPFIVVEYEDNGETIEALKREVEKITRHATVIKTKPDAFWVPEGRQALSLLQHLRQWKINGIVLAGIYAGACVWQTAASALDNRLKIATSGDLIALGGEDPGLFKEEGLYFKNCHQLLENLFTPRVKFNGEEKRVEGKNI